MTRDEHEMTLWCEAYANAYLQDWAVDASASIADRAVDEFRKRYPPSPPPTTATPEDARLGRAAMQAMHTIISLMRLETAHADTLHEIDRAIQQYIGQLWHIEKKDTP
jgi:hypothetical protein